MMTLARRAGGAAFGSHALAFARCALPGAPALLRKRLPGLLKAFRSAPKRRVREALGESCVGTAAALLILDPTSTRAAAALVNAYRDKHRYGEFANIVPWMREVVLRRPMLRSQAIDTVRVVLAELLDPSADEDDLGMAFPALAVIDQVRTAVDGLRGLVQVDRGARGLSQR